MMGGASKLLRLLSLSSPIPLLYTRTSTLRFFPHYWVSLNRISSPQNHNFFSNYRSFLGFSINSSQNIHTQISNITREDYYHADPPGFSPNSRVSHSWPEWSNLMANLRYGGYFDRQGYSVHHDDAFSVFDDLPEEFVRAANACLLFARDRPDLLGSLSRRDIDVVVENGSPFLFKSAIDSARRMKSFLGSHGSNEMEFERGCTVDLMHFLLSYACNPIAASRGNNINNGELVESSVRNLLSELANVSRNVRGFDLSRSTPTHFSDSYGQTSRPTRQNIEMKKGDWICPKCKFMNFARNMKCLECDEARPKKQLTGGEWECPQCDFFNYGRNAVCLRCDCKRPGEALIGSSGPRSAPGYSLNNPNNAEIESKLAENEEKAERWFSKISQQDNASDLSNGIADEDFPEIMPMRKGANRFVVSTRKTPLERRLANAQYRRNLGNDGIPEGNNSHAVGNESLDRIRGHSSAVSEINHNVTASENSLNESKVDSVYGKPTENSTQRPDDLRASSNGESLKGGSWQESRSYTVSSENNRESWKSLEGSAVKELDPLDMSEEAKAERWFRRVAQIKDISELSNIPDEDFPQIMPMRKGVNRFVVSKRKTPLERRLTSPQYRRNLPIVSSEPAKNENDSS